jgi:hypothetical protein
MTDEDTSRNKPEADNTPVQRPVPPSNIEIKTGTELPKKK